MCTLAAGSAQPVHAQESVSGEHRGETCAVMAARSTARVWPVAPTASWPSYATGSPALNRIRLWRVGAAGATLIARTPGTRNSTATLAAAADGVG